MRKQISFLASVLILSVFPLYSFQEYPYYIYQDENICCDYDCCQNSLFNSLYISPRVGYNIGKTVGVDREYLDVGLFMETRCGNTFFFAQGDAFRLDSGSRHHHHQEDDDDSDSDESREIQSNRWAASGGVGVRFTDCCSNFCSNAVFGFNAFYDYRKGCEHTFHQFGIGTEAFCNCWAFRANTYFPIHRRKCTRPVVFNDFIGDFEATCSVVEEVPFNVNIELERFFGCGCLFAYTAIGPYFLSLHDSFYAGYRFRSGVSYNGWIFAEAIITHDSFYRTRTQGVFSVCLPFSFFSCCKLPCECNYLIWQRVNRFDMIPLSRCCNWTWNW